MISNWTKKPLQYGVLNDAGQLARIPAARLKASEVFAAQSGKFVARDSSAGYFDVAIAADTQIYGFAVTHAHTVSASVPEYADIINDVNARFVLPVSGTPTTAMIGLTCDIVVSDGVQYANVEASSTDVLVIYDVNPTLGLVEVGLNPAKMHALGVV